MVIDTNGMELDCYKSQGQAMEPANEKVKAEKITNHFADRF